MPVKVPCTCGRTLSVPDSLAGKAAKCPACGESVAVPLVPGRSGASNDRAARAGRGGPPAGRRPCPSCGARLPPGSVVCTICGTDLRTGRSLLTTNFGWTVFLRKLRYMGTVILPPAVLIATALAAVAWYFGVFDRLLGGKPDEKPRSGRSAPSEAPTARPRGVRSPVAEGLRRVTRPGEPDASGPGPSPREAAGPATGLQSGTGGAGRKLPGGPDAPEEGAAPAGEPKEAEPVEAASPAALRRAQDGGTELVEGAAERPNVLGNPELGFEVTIPEGWRAGGGAILLAPARYPPSTRIQIERHRRTVDAAGMRDRLRRDLQVSRAKDVRATEGRKLKREPEDGLEFTCTFRSGSARWARRYAVIPAGRSIYVITLAAPQGDLRALDDDFKSVMKSFRVVTTP